MPSEDTESQTAQKSSSEIAAEWLERTTLPADIRIVVTGTFSSEDEAREVWAVTHYYLRLFGGFLDLSAVEAVTIADDYATTLAQVDRGFETTESPKPTNDEFGAGVAMALPVLRDGGWKTHLVVYSGIGRAVINPDNEWYTEALYTLAHEASHAHDNLRKVTAFPGLFGSRLPDYRDARLFNLADACW